MDSKKLELEDAKLREIERRERALLDQFQAAQANNNNANAADIARRQAQEREFQRQRIDYVPAVPIVPLTEGKRAVGAAGPANANANVAEHVPQEVQRAQQPQGLQGLEGYVPPPPQQQAATAKDPNKKKVVDPLQKWALVNISNHAHTRPKSSGPHVRIVGAYNTLKSMDKPRTKMSNSCKHVNFYKVPVGVDVEHCKRNGDFFVIAESEAKQSNAGFIGTHFTKLIEKLSESKRQSESEFKQNKSKTRSIVNEQQGLVPLKDDAELASFDDVQKMATTLGASAPSSTPPTNSNANANATSQTNSETNSETSAEQHSSSNINKTIEWDDFPRSLEIRGQNFACIAVIPDSESRQPAVRIFATFETEDDAKQFQIDVLGRRPELQVVNHYVVNMYQWIPLDPQHLNNSAMPSKYRNEELDLIMNAQRTEQEQIAQQKEQYEQNRAARATMSTLGAPTDNNTNPPAALGGPQPQK